MAWRSKAKEKTLNGYLLFSTLRSLPGFCIEGTSFNSCASVHHGVHFSFRVFQLPTSNVLGEGRRDGNKRTRLDVSRGGGGKMFSLVYRLRSYRPRGRPE